MSGKVVKVKITGNVTSGEGKLKGVVEMDLSDANIVVETNNGYIISKTDTPITSDTTGSSVNNFPDGEPSKAWTVPELKEYVEVNNIPIKGRKTEAALLAAITDWKQAQNNN